MPHLFDSNVVAAVLHHMNDDHLDDNLLIVRAFSPASEGEITAATMVDLDGDGGVWSFERGGTTHELRVAWPGGPISDRPAVRREVVALYDDACRRLDVPARPHD